MKRVLLATALLAALATGCASGSGYTARFLRYDRLPDGTRVAIVEPIAEGGTQADELAASTGLDDLKPGDKVLVEHVGKDWDQPQWTPEAQVTGRAQESGAE